MSIQGLEIRRSSASVLGQPVRHPRAARRSRSTSTRRPASAARRARSPARSGTTSPSSPRSRSAPTRRCRRSHADFWNLIRFNEHEVDGGIAWLMRKDQCMHCAEPGLPRGLSGAGRDRPVRQRHRRREPGPVHRLRLLRDRLPVRRAALLARRPARCPSARSASTASPSASSRRASRPAPRAASTSARRTTWSRWADRACTSSRPTASRNATLYDPQGVGGTSVVTVLAHGDHPEWYGLPADPHVPWGVKLWKKVLRPIGVLAIFGAVVGAFGHYTRYGPKEARGAERSDANLPKA